jgi:L-alanine-DL-glutamate epimerase-like enolase superfamily enzyme
MSDDLVTEHLVITDGMIAAPTVPGVGVTIDEDKLAHYRLDGTA